MKKSTATIFLLAVSLLLSYQTGICRRLPFQIYSQKNGLAAAMANCLLQTRNGYLWIGTNNGLSRFNGVEFKNFKNPKDLPGTYIYSLHQDSNGNLWIGTDNGAARFHQGTFTGFPHPEGPTGKRVFMICEGKKGTIWFATNNGLYRLDQKGFKCFTTADGLPSNYISCLRSLSHNAAGGMWVGTKNGLACFHENGLVKLNPRTRLRGTIVMTLQRDKNGGMLVGTRKGLYGLKMDPSVSQTSQTSKTSQTSIRQITTGSITAIHKDNDGTLWLGSNDGLQMVSAKDSTTITTANGLPSNSIRAILRDSENNLWLGTKNGTARLTRTGISTYTVKSGLPDNYINSILQDRNNNILLGTAKGLSCLKDGDFVNYSTKDGLIDNFIHHLMEDAKGNIWISTAAGISVLRTPNGTSTPQFTNYTSKDGLPGRYIFGLYRDRNGTIWIGGSEGIRRFQNGRFGPPPFKASHIKKVLNIMEDSKGNLWFSAQKTLYRFAEDTLTSYSTADGLPGGLITHLFQDRTGRIWISTKEGIACRQGDTFKVYSTDDGLPDNLCYFSMEDDWGGLWVGTANGMSRFNEMGFKAFRVPKFQLSTGSWHAGLKDQKGNLWLVGPDGLTHMVQPPVKRNHTPPPIHITGVKVLENEVPLSDTDYLKNLNHNENYIKIDFMGICLTAPETVIYKYRLENLEKNRRQTTEHSISYPYLPHGKYRFRVKAMNNDGVESTTPAEVFFIIHPHFSETWWFRGMIMLTACFIPFLLGMWRNKRAREKAERARAKTELEAKNKQVIMAQRMELMGSLAAGTVHDLKNQLAVILLYTQMMGRGNEASQRNQQNIDVIRQTASTAVQMSKQILSLARLPEDVPGEAELGELLEEIIETLNVILPEDVSISLQRDETPIYLAIHTARFQQLVINLCQNAAHAMPEGGRVRVSLSRTAEKDILLQVKDTGTGIEADKLGKIFQPLFTTKDKEMGTGLGLFVVKQIVEEYNGRIEVLSRQGEGTTFSIRFPSPAVLTT